MSTNIHTRLRAAREAGLVSIMVTLILMIVISLIVLGFAQISRRNQRQALDRQLSTQAFYAAETGVNDTRKLIDDAITSGVSIPAKPDCSVGSGAAAAFYASLTPNLDTDADVKYTCVMVNPTPTALLYNNVDTTSIIVPVISASGANISNIKLTWQSKGSSATPTANCPTSTVNAFPSTSGWLCDYGVLRMDLVRTDGALNYADLQNRTITTFFLPLSVGGSTGADSAAVRNNNLIGVDCSDAECSFSVTGLNANQFYMRISSLYKNVSLRINATDSTGGSLGLRDAQVVIDATGKAQDVLRRIQVHVPLGGSGKNKMSDYVMQSTDAICKRFVVMTGFFDSQAPAGLPNPNPINPLCAP